MERQSLHWIMLEQSLHKFLFAIVTPPKEEDGIILYILKYLKSIHLMDFTPSEVNLNATVPHFEFISMLDGLKGRKGYIVVSKFRLWCFLYYD